MRIRSVATLAVAASSVLITPARAALIGRPLTLAEALAVAGAEERPIRPAVASYFELDRGALAALLASAPDEAGAREGLDGVELELGGPDGIVRRYRVVDSPVMAPALAAKFPEIRTFRLVDAADPARGGRGDLTPTGFHAMVRTAEGLLFVDPLLPGADGIHQAYFKRDLPAPARGFRCDLEEESIAATKDAAWKPEAPAGGLDLRTYRLALAATGEYTQFHGGTVPLAMAAIVTAVNRVNEVYEHDLAIRMILVADNDSVVYTDGATDPYTNSSGGTMLGQNTTNLNTVIGSANYDIGHVFSTGGGGVATLNGPCGSNKARGVTGLTSPVGDPFYIDYVAHEMGHQWGANHTFNSGTGACGGGNRSAAHAYEPGSGSTIMAYAGICGADDLQPHSDAYFHRDSLSAIAAFSRTGGGNGCATPVSQGNAEPTVDAGPAFTIPRSTPFSLTGAGGDADGTVTYLWEQWDLGPAGSPGSPSGNAPIFRSFDPTGSPTRTFPKLSDLLGNVSTIGEILPSYARTLHFRLTVFDGDTPAGANAWDETTVVVDGASGPFLVTSPNTAVTWNGSGPWTVTWDVAGTSAAPVSCGFVDFLTSGDGGQTFDELVAEHVGNTGTTRIWSGRADTATARLKILCADNVFFDLSNANFTIQGASNLIFADGLEATDTRRWSAVSP